MTTLDLSHADAHSLEQRLAPIHEKTDEHDVVPITLEELSQAAWSLAPDDDSPPPPDVLRTLDDLYRYRTVRLLKSRSTEPGELQSFLEHLQKMAPAWLRPQMDANELPFGTRWQTLRSLLSIRLDELLNLQPASVLGKYDLMIAAIVFESGGVPRRELYSELSNTVKRSQSWLTQRLILLEAMDLVERKISADSLWVVPGVRLRDQQEKLLELLSSSERNDKGSSSRRRVKHSAQHTILQRTFGSVRN